jgi:hypothetical protein
MNQVRLGRALDGGLRIGFEFLVEQGRRRSVSTEVGDERGWPYKRVRGADTHT